MAESIEQFSFELTASALAEQERAESDHRGVSNVTEAYRTAGIWVEPHLEVNRSKIASLSNWLAVSCVLLAAEVILWTLSLIG